MRGIEVAFRELRGRGERPGVSDMTARAVQPERPRRIVLNSRRRWRF
ncbi:hypothetical protein HMPREF0185_02665 [Brevundimonas diminuta 470-4]|nr:hypothetical protein HMPREF0185_02665 [Brevundimonas diminuta 470-4]